MCMVKRSLCIYSLEKEKEETEIKEFFTLWNKCKGRVTEVYCVFIDEKEKEETGIKEAVHCERVVKDGLQRCTV